MDTIASWSDTSFAAPQAYDAEANRSFLESLKDSFPKAELAVNEVIAGAPEENAARAERMATLFEASERQSRLVNSSTARQNAQLDAYDRMVASVKEATGVALKNPLALDDWEGQQAADHARRMENMGFEDKGLVNLLGQRQSAFLDQVRELKAQNPEKLSGLDLETPIGDQARRNAFTAEQDQQKAWSDPNIGLVDALAASFAGGVYGARRDPLFWLSFAAPVGGKGATAAGRIVSAALTQGGTNAGLSALAQPTVQAWRAEAGLPAGWTEALKEIGLAGATGAALGGTLHSASDLVRLFHASGVHLDSETERAIAGAAAADHASAETLKAPETVPPETSATGFAEGLARGEDPGAPLPLVDRPVPSDTTDTLARHVLDGMVLDPGEFAARTEARALGLDPEAFARAKELDAAVEAARFRLDNLLSEKRSLTGQTFAVPRIEVLRGQLEQATQARIGSAANRVAALENEIAGITGKRKSSPRAKVLRAELEDARTQTAVTSSAEEEALRSEIERLGSQTEQMRASSLARLAATERELRLRLNEAQQQRGRIGPRLFAARQKAEEEAAAIGIEKGAPLAPEAAVISLRSSPAAVESALASPDPGIRDLGRLATLGDQAFDMVRAGDVDPVHGAIVAGTTGEPAQQAGLLQVIKEARPGSVDAARRVVADHVASRRAIEAAEMRMGGEPDRVARAEAQGFRYEGVHSTNRIFDEFDLGQAGSATDAGFYGRGIYFVPKQGIDDFGYYFAGGAENQISARLRIEKPLEVAVHYNADMFAQPRVDPETMARLRAAGWRHEGLPGDVYHAMGETRKGDTTVAQEFTQAAAKAGYDGVIVTDHMPSGESYVSEYVAYDPKNIRSSYDRFDSRAATDKGLFASGEYGAASSDLRDAVPIAREDGSVVMMARDSIDRVAEREHWMSDVIRSCKE